MMNHPAARGDDREDVAILRLRLENKRLQEKLDKLKASSGAIENRRLQEENRRLRLATEKAERLLAHERHATIALMNEIERLTKRLLFRGCHECCEVVINGQQEPRIAGVPKLAGIDTHGVKQWLRTNTQNAYIGVGKVRHVVTDLCGEIDALQDALAALTAERLESDVIEEIDEEVEE